MANPEHLAILKQGVDVWNAWRMENPDIKPQLKGAVLDDERLGDLDLDEADLSYSSLVNADLGESHLDHTVLRDASLVNAKLSRAVLVRTDLSGAKLCGANFFETYLIDSILDKANLEGADLEFANLFQTSLKATNFEEALLGWTVFADVDLGSAKGLENVIHLSPSIIGVESIHRSKGRIPESFLRGCGVPRKFISYARSLVTKSIQYFTCMISYSSKDERFCKRLYESLQARDVQVWRFAEDAKLGESVWKEIEGAIKNYDKVIPVCSKNSLHSPKVLREIDRALEREDREGKNILFPIAIDNHVFDEWENPRKADVLAKVIGTDFIDWNRDAAKYSAAFKKLLKALKTEDALESKL